MCCRFEVIIKHGPIGDNQKGLKETFEEIYMKSNPWNNSWYLVLIKHSPIGDSQLRIFNPLMPGGNEKVTHT